MQVIVKRDEWVDEDLREDAYDPANTNGRTFCAITATSGGGSKGTGPCEVPSPPKPVALRFDGCVLS